MSEAVKPNNQTGAAVNESVAYERKDVNAWAIFWIGVVMIVAAVIIHTGVWWLFDAFDRREAQKGRPPATLVQTQRPETPVPRLQTNAPADLNTLRTAENNELESYGWIDQQKGIVRIPVEQAMTLLVERGLPKTPTNEHDAQPNAAPEQKR
jgi:cytoskeletal protein RodZ